MEESITVDTSKYQNIYLSNPAAETMASSKKQTPLRKRAARACTWCRARKVRCDVVRCGPPCTNCRLDSESCVVRKRKRKIISYERASLISGLQDSSSTLQLTPVDPILGDFTHASSLEPVQGASEKCIGENQDHEQVYDTQETVYFDPREAHNDLHQGAPDPSLDMPG